MPGFCDLRVQRVRQGFQRKTVLWKKHRFKPAPEALICYGTPEQFCAFIYAQRGERPKTPMADLREYLVEVSGRSPEWAEQYAVLRKGSIDHEEAADEETDASRRRLRQF